MDDGSPLIIGFGIIVLFGALAWAVQHRQQVDPSEIENPASYHEFLQTKIDERGQTTD